MPGELFNPGEVEIKHLSVEAPPARPELRFDIEEEMTEEDWRDLLEEVAEGFNYCELMAADPLSAGFYDYAWVNILRPGGSPVLLDLEATARILHKFKQLREEDFGLSSKVKAIAAMRLVAPPLSQRWIPNEDMLSEYIDSTAERNLYKLTLDISGHARIISAELGDKLRSRLGEKIAKKMLDDFKVNLTLNAAASKQPFDVDDVRCAAMARVFLPDLWDNTIAVNELWDFALERFRLRQKEGGWSDVCMLGAYLNILSAHAVRVTEDGIQLDMYPPQDFPDLAQNPPTWRDF
jgi:hypothetical protein